MDDDLPPYRVPRPSGPPPAPRPYVELLERFVTSFERATNAFVGFLEAWEREASKRS